MRLLIKIIVLLDTLHRQMKHKQEDYLRRLTDLEQEIELIRQRARLERYKELDELPRQLQPPHIPAQFSALMVICNEMEVHRFFSSDILRNR